MRDLCKEEREMLSSLEIQNQNQADEISQLKQQIEIYQAQTDLDPEIFEMITQSICNTEIEQYSSQYTTQQLMTQKGAVADLGTRSMSIVVRGSRSDPRDDHIFVIHIVY